MRLKQLIIVAIGILVVGAGLLLGQRISSPQAHLQYDGTDESNQIDQPSTPASIPKSGVTSEIDSELTSMPSVTQALNNLPGVASATGTAPNDLTVTSLSPSISTSDLTEGLIGDPATPPGRLAPDVLMDSLQFSNIRIYKANDSGFFSVQANVKNQGTAFLNNLLLTWTILDGAGQVLDQGQVAWPNLAPNETATITLVGKAPFLETWSQIEFAYVR